jgi:hypothetical protein
MTVTAIGRLLAGLDDIAARLTCQNSLNMTRNQPFTDTDETHDNYGASPH